MSNREFTATRTMLANAFATAGAELLEYMGVSSALVAIPNTEPPQYVVAGTLRMIGKMLPNDEAQPLYDDNGEPWNEAAEREVAAEKPTGDLTPVTTLTGEQLHKFYVEASGGVDEGLVAVANAAIAAHLERQAQAKDRTIIEMRVRIAAPASQEGAHAALEEVRGAAQAVIDDALEEARDRVHPCDQRNDEVVTRSLSPLMQNLIRALKTPASAERSGDHA